MVDFSDDLVWSFHPDTYQIQWVNSACQARLGMQAGEDCRVYLRPDLYFVESVVHTVQQFTRWEGVLNFLEPQQQQPLPLFSKVIQVENESNPLMVCTSVDLRQKQLLESSLIQQAKLASIGKMTCNLAHEITNPLSIIIGRAEELLRKARHQQLTQEVVDKELSRILQTSHRIGRITKSLRSFGRNAEKDPKTQIFLSRIIDEVLDLCQDRLHHHGIELRRVLEPNLFVEVRASEIEQVLVNLLLNAIDALQTASTKWIEIRAELVDSWTRIRITDSGVGIAPEIASEIMKPFFTTKEPGLGTGLGLSISQSLILDHGGRLFLDPDSKHTCFIVELPALQNKSK